MKGSNFIQRVVFGAAYVGLILGSLWLGSLSFGFVCLLILILSLDEYFRLIKRLKFRPPDILILICAGLSFVLVFLNRSIDLSYKYLFFIPLSFIVIMTREVYKRSKNPLYNLAFGTFGFVYVFFPLTSLFTLGFFEYYSWTEEFQKEIPMAFFILVWANDTGAYLAGSAFGKRKLFERISPRKTLEGSLGGLALSLVIAYLISMFADQVSLLDWMVISMLIVIFGTLGDLFESLLKRKVDVKDSGNLIPGHGGMLDRFDSVLFAAPVVFTYLALISH